MFFCKDELKVMHLEHLESHLAHCKHSTNVSYYFDYDCYFYNLNNFSINL